MVDVDQQTLAGGLVPVVDLVQRAHLAGRHADLGEASQQRLGVPVGEGRLDERDRLLAVGDPLGVGGESLGSRVEREAVAQTAPQPLAAHRDLDGSVAAVEQAVGADRGVVVALGDADLAGDGPARALEGVHPDGGGQQRGAYDAPDAGAVPLVQRREDAVRAVHPGEQVRDRHADALRVLGTRTCERHQSGLALGDLVVAGATALGPVVTEARDGEHDEPRVALLEQLEAQAEPVEHAGAEVLHEHVGTVDELQQDVAVGLVLEVEGDRLLVAVGREEVRRLPVVLGADERWPPATGVVAVALGLDLDHAGTEVAQHHRGLRPGQGAGEVDDEHVGERCAGHQGHHPGRTRAAHTRSGPARVTSTP